MFVEALCGAKKTFTPRANGPESTRAQQADDHAGLNGQTGELLYSREMVSIDEIGDAQEVVESPCEASRDFSHNCHVPMRPPQNRLMALMGLQATSLHAGPDGGL